MSTIWTVKQHDIFIESYFKKIGFIFFHYVITLFFLLESLQFFSKSINDLDLTCPVTYFLSVCEGPPLGPVADPDSWCTVPLSSPCCVLYSLEKAQQPAKLVVHFHDLIVEKKILCIHCGWFYRYFTYPICFIQIVPSGHTFSIMVSLLMTPFPLHIQCTFFLSNVTCTYHVFVGCFFLHFFLDF